MSRCLCRAVLATLCALPALAAESGGALGSVSIPTIDLAGDQARQIIVDREPGQYLGHPTTVLLEDGKTLLCVYPRGHGKGAITYQRSPDGGHTWSGRLPVPANWATSLETPTIHRVVDAAGRKRLIVWSGLYPARLAFSEDDGGTWSPLEPAGGWGGIVVMGSVEDLKAENISLIDTRGRMLNDGTNRGESGARITSNQYQQQKRMEDARQKEKAAGTAYLAKAATEAQRPRASDFRRNWATLPLLRPLR